MNDRLTTNRLRRRLLAGGAGALATAGLGTLSRAALAQGSVELPFANGRRRLAAYPEKRPLIVLTSRPPQLETPFEVYNEGLITPNDAFFVRYHHAGIPTSIDGDAHVVRIGGSGAGKPYELTMAALRTQFRPVELVAVNQCSGNSRGLMNPRVGGGQLAHGAMGNARWTGVPLKEVLARAAAEERRPRRSPSTASTTRPSAAPTSSSRCRCDHAMDGEVMLAWQMNGADLPLLNGFPVRLVVPGHYGTYWVKHLSDIEIVDSRSRASG